MARPRKNPDDPRWHAVDEARAKGDLSAAKTLSPTRIDRRAAERKNKPKWVMPKMVAQKSPGAIQYVPSYRRSEIPKDLVEITAAVPVDSAYDAFLAFQQECAHERTKLIAESATVSLVSCLVCGKVEKR